MYEGNQYSTSHTVSSPDTILRPEYTQRSVQRFRVRRPDYTRLQLPDAEIPCEGLHLE